MRAKASATREDGLLRSGLAMPEIEARVGEAIWHKPWGHGLAHNVVAGNRVMSEIGG